MTVVISLNSHHDTELQKATAAITISIIFI